MRAGQLRNRISILSHSQAKDEWGSPVPGAGQWLPITSGDIWANIKHLSGTETVRAGIDVSTVRASIRIRWRTGIDAGMRVRHGAELYEVEAVLRDQHHKHVDLVCITIQGKTQ